MANNYDVLSSTGIDTAGATVSSVDFTTAGGGVSYGQNINMLIIPHAGFTISAADFTIGGSTPSASAAQASTGGVQRTFTHGSGGCVLPNTYLTALTMRDTAAPHTSANMIAINFTGFAGTFPTSNTTIQIDIDGLTKCITHGYSFNEDIPSYWPTDPNSFSGTNVLFWSEIVLNNSCTSCFVGPPVTIGNITRRAMSGKCCANTSYFHYSRTFTCKNGFYFHNFPLPVLSVNNSSSYTINEVVLVSDDTTGLPTSIRFDISYTCGRHSTNLDKTDVITWRTPECGNLPSPPQPRIISNTWADIMSQKNQASSLNIIEGGSTVGLKITSSLHADYDVVLTQLDSSTTYDFNTSFFTTKRTTLKQAPESLLQKFPRFGIEELRLSLAIPSASSVPMYYQASIEPSLWSANTRVDGGQPSVPATTTP